MSYHIPNKLQLINLVRERPALWDKTSDLYKDKLLKAAAWREICAILNKDYQQFDLRRQQLFGKYVIKIWTHTRDGWVRSLNNRKKYTKSGFVPRPYKYNKQMLFLKKVVGTAKPHEHDDVSDKSDESEDSEEEPISEESESVVFCETDWNIDSIKTEIDHTANDSELNKMNETDTVNTTDEIDAKIGAYINNRMKEMKNTSNTQEDRHFAFFKSIQPTLTLLNDDQTLEFQSGVINLLRNIKSGRKFNEWPNDSPSSSSQRRFYYNCPSEELATEVPIVRQRVMDQAASSAGPSRHFLRTDP